MRRTLLVAVALLVLLPMTAAAQPSSFVAGEGNHGSLLEAAVPEVLARHDAVGAALALVRDGEVVWVEGFGTADTAAARTVTAETIFNAGSISKTVTAWGVMRLVEQGMLELDEPVATYLTRWRFPESAFDSEGVTVRRLLSHTAGLSMPSIPGFEFPAPLPSLEANLAGDYGRSVYAAPGSPVELVQPPGAGFRYSGGGFVLLQLLVEEVTSESFAAHMQRELLGPLGMTSSRFGWDESMAAVAAVPYDASGRALPTYRFAGTAGAGLYTTASDLARFVAAGLPGPAGAHPGRGVLDNETVALMYQPAKLSDGSPGEAGLGYGFRSYGEEQVEAVIHLGGNAGWRALIVAVPERRQDLVILTNSDNGGEVVEELADLWADAEFGASAEQPQAEAVPAVKLELRLAFSEAAPGLLEAEDESNRTIYIQPVAFLSNEHVRFAGVTTAERGIPAVAIYFTPEGSRIWATVTGGHIGEPVAILLDGVVVTAPIVRERLDGGEARITGIYTEDEARRIAAGIMAR